MPNANIEKQVKDLGKHIDLLEDWWKSSLDDDEQIQAQVIGTHYLVVAAYGIIEAQMKEMICSYIEERSHPNVYNAMKQVVSIRYSWNFHKIKSVLNEFNHHWREQATKIVSQQQKDAITTLKNTRDKIAHGASCDAGFHDAKAQFESAVEGLHIISDIIRTDPVAELSIAP